jgi:hypothetical protein
MILVVADTAPLHCLVIIGHEFLLPRLAGRIEQSIYHDQIS